MMKKSFLAVLTIVFGLMISASLSLAQFNGTHIYSLHLEGEEQGYVTVTFNPDGTIVGEARLLFEEKPLPLLGRWGKTIFVIKYRLSDNTVILDHCRFVSDTEFIGFERSSKDGVAVEGIARIFGSERENI
ncbi:MAG: hypothetical protein ACMUIA_04375 [bacterium]